MGWPARKDRCGTESKSQTSPSDVGAGLTTWSRAANGSLRDRGIGLGRRSYLDSALLVCSPASGPGVRQISEEAFDQSLFMDFDAVADHGLGQLRVPSGDW